MEGSPREDEEGQQRPSGEQRRGSQTEEMMAIWWENKRKKESLEAVRRMRQRFKEEVEKAVGDGKLVLDDNLHEILSARSSESRIVRRKSVADQQLQQRMDEFEVAKKQGFAAPVSARRSNSMSLISIIPVDTKLVSKALRDCFFKHLTDLQMHAPAERRHAAVDALQAMGPTFTLIDRKFLGMQGGVERLYTIVRESDDTTLVAKSLRLLVELCKHCEANLERVFEQPGCTKCLLVLLRGEHTDTRAEAMRLVGGLASVPNLARSLAATDGILDVVVGLLRDSDRSVQERALAAVWMFSDRFEVLQIVVATPNVLANVSACFVEGNTTVKTRAVGILYRLARVSDIAAKQLSNMDSLLDAMWQMAMEGEQEQLSLLSCKLLVVLTKQPRVLQRMLDIREVRGPGGATPRQPAPQAPGAQQWAQPQHSPKRFQSPRSSPRSPSYSFQGHPAAQSSPRSPHYPHQSFTPPRTPSPRSPMHSPKPRTPSTPEQSSPEEPQHPLPVPERHHPSHHRPQGEEKEPGPQQAAPATKPEPEPEPEQAAPGAKQAEPEQAAGPAEPEQAVLSKQAEPEQAKRTQHGKHSRPSKQPPPSKHARVPPGNSKQPHSPEQPHAFPGRVRQLEKRPGRSQQAK